MKYKTLELSFFIAILIISSVTLLFIMSESRDHEKNMQKKACEEVETIKSEKFLLELYVRQSFTESVLNNNLLLNESHVIFSNEGKINFTKPKLVYRYSSHSCNMCIDFGILKLKEHFEDCKNNNNLLFVISDYPSKYQMDHSNYVNLNKVNLDLPIEKTYQPFYFILIDGNVQQVFIPDKGIPEYTDVYLQEIKKRYFSK